MPGKKPKSKSQIKLVVVFNWLCNNYDLGQSFGRRCPYCPYSLDPQTNRLLYLDQPTASNTLAEPQDFIDFFRANAAILGRSLEITGGESLLYPHLAEVLAALPGWRWAMTSNTTIRPALEKLRAAGVLTRCAYWTASYHPLSGRDKVYAENIRFLRAHGVKRIAATVVATDHTLPTLPQTIQFLKTLPLTKVQFHLDSHRSQDQAQVEREARKHLPHADFYAGDVIQGVDCRRHRGLLAAGPDGTLYECVSKMYTDTDPLGKVNGQLLLADLPDVTQWCDVECFAVCDRVKYHVIQPARSIGSIGRIKGLLRNVFFQ